MEDVALQLVALIYLVSVVGNLQSEGPFQAGKMLMMVCGKAAHATP